MYYLLYVHRYCSVNIVCTVVTLVSRVCTYVRMYNRKNGKNVKSLVKI